MKLAGEVWVCPSLHGPITGGTRYNAGILSALAVRGASVPSLGFEEASRDLDGAARARYWVDSLFLDRFQDLNRHNVGRMPLCLVVHYLPSLVSYGAVPPREALFPGERAALETASAFLATSGFIRDALARLGVPARKIVTAAPGVDLGDSNQIAAGRRGGRFSALMVANVVPGKGVGALLRELAPLLTAKSAFELSVVGSLELDASYAAECRALVANEPCLAARVRFEGALPHGAVLERMRTTDVLVSASRMESFGMALAEGRAVGLPILARQGGHAAAHVDPAAGGELVADDAALAAALVRLSADPDETRARARRAMSARAARTWDDTARDFLAGIATLSEDAVRGDERPVAR